MATAGLGSTASLSVSSVGGRKPAAAGIAASLEFDAAEHLRDCHEAGIITSEQYKAMLSSHKESAAMLRQAGSA